jgi:hypothetical protein
MKVIHYTNPDKVIEITFSHIDEFGGFWFTSDQGLMFAHNPEYPNTTDPIIALQYDYTIVE